jgi:hypothetical protein
MTIIEQLAKAMYDANEFVRGWDHPRTNKMWHRIYRRYARICLRELAKIKRRKGKK